MSQLVEAALNAEIGKPVLTVLEQEISILVLALDCSEQVLTAAPPAIVPSSIGLISMTFLTVCEAIQFPAVALESVATIIPPLNLNARVVVPWAILIGQFGFEASSVIARRKFVGRSIGGRANLRDSGGNESA